MDVSETIIDLCAGASDLTIKSEDGVKFLVSRYVICVYSPTLRNLLEDTKETMIDIDESSETLKWVLTYIFDDLNKKNVAPKSITPDIYRLCFSWNLITMNVINKILVDHIKRNECNPDDFIISNEIFRDAEITHAFIHWYIRGRNLRPENDTLASILESYIEDLYRSLGDWKHKEHINAAITKEFNKPKKRKEPPTTDESVAKTKK